MSNTLEFGITPLSNKLKRNSDSRLDLFQEKADRMYEAYKNLISDCVVAEVSTEDSVLSCQQFDHLFEEQLTALQTVVNGTRPIDAITQSLESDPDLELVMSAVPNIVVPALGLFAVVKAFGSRVDNEVYIIDTAADSQQRTSIFEQYTSEQLSGTPIQQLGNRKKPPIRFSLSGSRLSLAAETSRIQRRSLEKLNTAHPGAEVTTPTPLESVSTWYRKTAERPLDGKYAEGATFVKHLPLPPIACSETGSTLTPVSFIDELGIPTLDVVDSTLQYATIVAYDLAGQ